MRGNYVLSAKEHRLYDYLWAIRKLMETLRWLDPKRIATLSINSLVLNILLNYFYFSWNLNFR